jgi:hypothetical protein
MEEKERKPGCGKGSCGRRCQEERILGEPGLISGRGNGVHGA